jgi:mono/diheme cytochrome c family protein
MLRRTAVVGVGVLFVVAAAVSASAQKVERVPAKPLASAEGVETFKAYCSACHGVSARGDGPAAKALAKTPADLTQIAKRHNGKFSATDVEGVIIGNNMMMAHGSREMPIWGPIFEATSTDQAVMKLRVANLVKYLQAIQQ